MDMPKSKPAIPMNLDLPEDPVSPINSHQEFSTTNFKYKLHNKKIYAQTCTPDDPKKIDGGNLVPDKDADAGQWKLFDGEGIPFNKKREPLLTKGMDVIEIAGSCEILLAVARDANNNDRVYIYKPTELTRPTHWEKHVGAPHEDKLFLPKNRRAWGFGCSVRTKPEVRTTDFMNSIDIVEKFSDAKGVQFDYGFTPTICVLLEPDGVEPQKIVIWDTGLPTGFSRGLLLPDGVEGLDIQVAGSTIVLTARNRNGEIEIYTIGFDYEMRGACPGLAVTYNNDLPPIYPDSDPNKSYFLGQGIRALPLQGWIKHPITTIRPNNVTHKVDIRVTGTGDAERELRLQGQDSQSRWGYYSKKIFESDWAFHLDPAAEPKNGEEIKFSPEPLIPERSKKDYIGQPSNAESAPFIAGRLFQGKQRFDFSPITADVKDFHPFMVDSDPLSIVLKYPGEPSQRLSIYPLDAWSLHYNHENDHDIIGKDEPKGLVGTLKLTKEQIKLTEDPKSVLGAYIKKRFLPFHLKTKSISLIGNDCQLVMEVGHKEYNFQRTLSELEIASSFYMKKALVPELDKMPNTFDECKKLIDLNKACLEELKAIFTSRRRVAKLSKMVNSNANIARPIASSILKVVDLDDPTYRQAMKDLKILFHIGKEVTDYSLNGKFPPSGYNFAINILSNRIKYYEELSLELEHQAMRFVS